MKVNLVLLAILCLILGGCANQNMELVSDGETLADSPPPVADPNARPFAISGAADDKMKIPPFVKAYFMHMWVEALYSTPQNKNPNPHWQSPLLDPVNGRVWCTDCHKSNQV